MASSTNPTGKTSKLPLILLALFFLVGLLCHIKNTRDAKKSVDDRTLATEEVAEEEFVYFLADPDIEWRRGHEILMKKFPEIWPAKDVLQPLTEEEKTLLVRGLFYPMLLRVHDTYPIEEMRANYELFFNSLPECGYIFQHGQPQYSTAFLGSGPRIGDRPTLVFTIERLRLSFAVAYSILEGRDLEIYLEDMFMMIVLHEQYHLVVQNFWADWRVKGVQYTDEQILAYEIDGWKYNHKVHQMMKANGRGVEDPNSGENEIYAAIESGQDVELRRLLCKIYKLDP